MILLTRSKKSHRFVLCGILDPASQIDMMKSESLPLLQASRLRFEKPGEAIRAWERYRDERSSEAERDVKRAEELYDGLTRRLEHLRAS